MAEHYRSIMEDQTPSDAAVFIAAAVVTVAVIFVLRSIAEVLP